MEEDPKTLIKDKIAQIDKIDSRLDELDKILEEEKALKNQKRELIRGIEELSNYWEA